MELTVSEPADVLLEGQQGRGEGALQSQAAAFLHPCWGEGAAKLGFLLKSQNWKGGEGHERMHNYI